MRAHRRAKQLAAGSVGQTCSSYPSQSPEGWVGGGVTTTLAIV